MFISFMLHVENFVEIDWCRDEVLKDVVQI